MNLQNMIKHDTVGENNIYLEIKLLLNTRCAWDVIVSTAAYSAVLLTPCLWINFFSFSLISGVLWRTCHCWLQCFILNLLTTCGSFQDSMVSVFKDKSVTADGLLSLKRTLLINKTHQFIRHDYSNTHSRDQCQSGYMLKVDQDLFLFS